MMKRAAGRLAAVAAMICTANPCLAQDRMSFETRPEQASAFAGLNLRLELGRGKSPVPTARLVAGRMHDWRRTDLPVSQSREAGNSIELGVTRSGRAELHVGGQPMKQVKARLGANDLGSPVWIVGGIVLLVVGVLVISNLDSLGDNEPAN